MTPKEQAKELVHRYVDLTDSWVYGIKSWEHKKKCALIAVDQVLNLCWGGNKVGIKYWQDVKQEIEKL